VFLPYFGLTENPFGVTPNPRFLYFTREQREVAASLYYGIVEDRGFGVVVARPGVGKTTLLYYLRQRIEPLADTALVVYPFDTKDQLLQAVMMALGLPPYSLGYGYLQNWRRFQNFLLKRQAENRKVVLMFDEAQQFSEHALENIRLLSNLETTEKKLLHIILSGQPLLIEKLRSRALEQLAQRVQNFCEIHPLSEDDVGGYITHRLRVAGCEEKLFTSDGIAATSRCSQGIPRNINAICYNSMALACALDRTTIDDELVLQVVYDLQMNSLECKPTACQLTVRVKADQDLATHEYPGRRESRNGSPSGAAPELEKTLRELIHSWRENS
jgi:general secretion pathway protein A